MFPSGSNTMKTMISISLKIVKVEKEIRVASRNMMTFSKRNKSRPLLRSNWSTQRLEKKLFSRLKVLKASTQNGTKSSLTLLRPRTKYLSKSLN
jgi:hypothetical protein